MNKTLIVIALLAVYGACHSFSENTKVLQLTVENFSTVTGIGSGQVLKNTIGMFYAPWCGHCKKLVPVYEELAAAVPEVNVVAVDCTQHKVVCDGFEVKGYPTVLFFSTDGRQIKYQKPRTLDALKAFVTEEYKAEAGVDISFQQPSVVAQAAQDAVSKLQVFVNDIQAKVGGPLPFFGGIALLVTILVGILVFPKKQDEPVSAQNQTPQPKEAKKRD